MPDPERLCCRRSPGCRARTRQPAPWPDAGCRVPGTARTRTAVTEAGFSPDAEEVTASRTPTGLAADAAKAAFRRTGTASMPMSAKAASVLSSSRCGTTAGAPWAQRGPAECELSRLSH
ncbi:DUF6993 domain-containing protein [Arthrobacter sp. CG_A4]|uniref:DUF6993 domain-containing protein n=1 Tax=Arthrobacter sp. CG_A4 TaxID=3071706 RepID=UPI003FA378C3